MNEYISTALKSIVVFIILLILTRISGRKQISQLTFFDYVVGISIGSIAGNLVTDRNLNFYDGIIAILIWSIIPILVGLAAVKNITFRKLVDSEPLIIINKGIVEYKNMLKAHYNIGDLLMQLRDKDIFDITEVEFALLEPDGKLSVLKKSSYLNPTLKDLNIPSNYKGLMVDLIENGEILHQHLQLIQKNEVWLFDELRKKNIPSLKNILYAGYQTNGELYVAFKERESE